MTEQTISYKQTGWSLDDLVAGGEQTNIEKLFGQVQEKAGEFANQTRPMLDSQISTETFLSVVRGLEEINRLAYHLYGYASLSFSANTQDQEAQTLLARVQQFMAEMQNEILFFELWWKKIADETANRLISSAGDYRYWLEEMRHFKPHTLTEAERGVHDRRGV